MKNILIGVATFALYSAVPVAADWTEARCDIYPVGEDHTDRVMPCTFSQRQGHINITREDGVVHDLSPEGDMPGNYRDQHGDRVYRQSGLGDQGLIFRFPEESVYVYWNPRLLEEQGGAGNFNAPFTTNDYDATTRLRCRAAGDAEFGSCSAGIMRIEGGQASIVIRSPHGDIFTINFMKDSVNATNRETEATFDGEHWTVVVDGAEVYEVPVAAIEGG